MVGVVEPLEFWLISWNKTQQEVRNCRVHPENDTPGVGSSPPPPQEKPRETGVFLCLQPRVTCYVRWVDPGSKSHMTQKMESKESAELLLTVLKAHGSDVDAALKSAKDYFGGV